jgi:hypothetical protein
VGGGAVARPARSAPRSIHDATRPDAPGDPVGDAPNVDGRGSVVVEAFVTTRNRGDRAKGYDPRLLEKQGQYDTFDVESLSGMQGRYVAGMTVSMVRQTVSQTKVKIRFDNIYYPRLVEEYYKLVWTTVDKQIFLDKGLD